MTTNNQRTGWAAQALQRFAEITDGNLFEGLPPVDQQGVLSDLLADLNHYAEQAGLDFGEALRIAIWQYDHERQFPRNEDTQV